LSKYKAAYGTVNKSDMTREEKLSYEQDNDKKRHAAFVDAHCGMKAYAYVLYLHHQHLQGQTKGTKMQGLHSQLPEAERRRKGKSPP
jgi:hypothetical protein